MKPKRKMQAAKPKSIMEALAAIPAKGSRTLRPEEVPYPQDKPQAAKPSPFIQSPAQKPWRVGPCVGKDDPNKLLKWWGIGNGLVHIARVVETGAITREQARENAALIVRAVNAHAGLVAFARRIVNQGRKDKAANMPPFYLPATVDEARAALRAAGEEV